jgi:hypothetical protein
MPSSPPTGGGALQAEGRFGGFLGELEVGRVTVLGGEVEDALEGFFLDASATGKSTGNSGGGNTGDDGKLLNIHER